MFAPASTNNLTFSKEENTAALKAKSLIGTISPKPSSLTPQAVEFGSPPYFSNKASILLEGPVKRQANKTALSPKYLVESSCALGLAPNSNNFFNGFYFISTCC